MTDVLDDARQWLTPCGTHDYGMPEYGCMCNTDDYRPTMSRLVDEVRRLRDSLALVKAAHDKTRQILGAEVESIEDAAARVVRERDEARAAMLPPGTEARQQWSVGIERAGDGYLDFGAALSRRSSAEEEIGFRARRGFHDPGVLLVRTVHTEPWRPDDAAAGAS